MYGAVNVHEFIRIGALIRMRAPIGIGALIDKNTFEGGRLFGRGCLLEGGRLIESLWYFIFLEPVSSR